MVLSLSSDDLNNHAFPILDMSDLPEASLLGLFHFAHRLPSNVDMYVRRVQTNTPHTKGKLPLPSNLALSFFTLDLFPVSYFPSLLLAIQCSCRRFVDSREPPRSWSNQYHYTASNPNSNNGMRNLLLNIINASSVQACQSTGKYLLFLWFLQHRGHLTRTLYVPHGQGHTRSRRCLVELGPCLLWRDRSRPS
jgi:hypothetical protein